MPKNSGSLRANPSIFKWLSILIGVASPVLFILLSSKQPEWGSFALVAGILLTYLLLGISDYRSEDTPDGFFLFDRKMPPKMFVWTFVATNVGLFSSIAYSAILAFTFGIAGMLWPTLAWFLGMYWFSRRIPSLIPFFRKGSTLHEYIANMYGHTDHSRDRLKLLSSVVTSSLFWASVAIEIKFGSIVLTPIIGFPSAISLAIVIATVGIAYSYAAGFRSATHTDRIQGIIMALGIPPLVWGCVSIAREKGFHLPEHFFGFPFVVSGPDAYTLVSMAVLLTPYQFCVMDMWQRCIAIAGSDFGTGKSLSDEELSKQLRRLTFWKALLPFLILFIGWYAIGIVGLGANLTADPAQILPAFLDALAHHAGPSGTILRGIGIVVFVSAMISTIDTFLVALTQTFMCDVYATRSRRYRHVLTTGSDFEKRRFVDASRFFIGIFGLLATLLAFFDIGLLDFWVTMYSLMLALFGPVYLGIQSGSRIKPTNATFICAYAAILIGFIAALTFGVLGTFVFKNSNIANTAPIAGIVASVLFMLPVWWNRSRS